MAKYFQKFFNKNQTYNNNDHNHTLDMVNTLEKDDEAQIKLDSLRFQHTKDKLNFCIKLGQLFIVNIIIVILLNYAVLYVNKLLALITQNPNVVWILGTFTLGTMLSILYMCGLLVKFIFAKSNKEEESNVTLLELLSKIKINLTNKQD